MEEREGQRTHFARCACTHRLYTSAAAVRRTDLGRLAPAWPKCTYAKAHERQHRAVGPPALSPARRASSRFASSTGLCGRVAHLPLAKASGEVAPRPYPARAASRERPQRNGRRCAGEETSDERSTIRRARSACAYPRIRNRVSFVHVVLDSGLRNNAAGLARRCTAGAGARPRNTAALACHTGHGRRYAT